MDKEFKTFLKYGFAGMGIIVVFCTLLAGMVIVLETVHPTKACVMAK